jgi:DNA-binding NtrC family response regulator
MTPPSRESSDLLLVANPKEIAELERLFRLSGMSVFAAADCRQARQRLASSSDPAMVVTSLSLKDGSWWSIRKALIERQSMAALVVCLPTLDGGLTDVLEAGCTAVLVPPYKLDRVEAVVEATKARRVSPKPVRRDPGLAAASKSGSSESRNVA